MTLGTLRRTPSLTTSTRCYRICDASDLAIQEVHTKINLKQTESEESVNEIGRQTISKYLRFFSHFYLPSKQNLSGPMHRKSRDL